MKKTIKGVLDGFRSSVPQPVKPDQEIVENLRPEHFQVKKVSIEHGREFALVFLLPLSLTPYLPSVLINGPVDNTPSSAHFSQTFAGFGEELVQRGSNRRQFRPLSRGMRSTAGFSSPAAPND